MIGNKIKPRNTEPVVLASGSPRRSRLLEQAGIAFDIILSRIDEYIDQTLHPAEAARNLAEAKAKQVAGKRPDAWIIGADSIVVIDDQILGKPKSRTEAKEMLRALSGRTHIVYTGYAIIHPKNTYCYSDVAETRVSFKRLSENEIDWYTATPEPYDKAGGYALQGTGAFMITMIEGSPTNVIGLPLCEVIDYLYRQGILN